MPTVHLFVLCYVSMLTCSTLYAAQMFVQGEDGGFLLAFPKPIAIVSFRAHVAHLLLKVVRLKGYKFEANEYRNSNDWETWCGAMEQQGMCI